MFAHRLARLAVRWWALTGTLLVLSLVLTTGALAADKRVPLWQPPVTGQVQVLREFDKPAQKWSAGHRGVDLALEADGEIRAPAAGKVTFSGTVVDRKVITIQHADGRKSSFEPVTDELPVGTEVTEGQVIAHLDGSKAHCTAGPCLHWGVREGTGESEEYVNPLLFLGLTDPSILLPIGDDFGA